VAKLRLGSTDTAGPFGLFLPGVVGGKHRGRAAEHARPVSQAFAKADPAIQPIQAAR